MYPPRPGLSGILDWTSRTRRKSRWPSPRALWEAFISTTFSGPRATGWRSSEGAGPSGGANTRGTPPGGAPDLGAWKVISPPDGFERNSMFVDEMRHFLDVVQGEAQPMVTLDDGVKALEIAHQALTSARGSLALKTPNGGNA